MSRSGSSPHLIKVGHTFTHSVEKGNILAEMFSKNSSLSESDQLLSFTMPEVHIRTREVKRVLANLDIKKSLDQMVFQLES